MMSSKGLASDIAELKKCILGCRTEVRELLELVEYWEAREEEYEHELYRWMTGVNNG